MKWTFGPALLVLAMLFAGNRTRVLGADVIVFDEDDSLGADYYDASIGVHGSNLDLGATTRDKMPIQKGPAFSGHDSGVLKWSSEPEGKWELILFAPGFPLLNVAHCESFNLALNGPDASLGASWLPTVRLTDVNGKSLRAKFGNFIKNQEGQKPGTWQSVSIPLKAFIGDSSFDFSNLKHVSFVQGDRETAGIHILWIDDVRFADSISAAKQEIPAAPNGFQVRSGDRSVLLHWNASPGTQRYRVSRASGTRSEFAELPGSPITGTAYADTGVQNGIEYHYRVTAENSAGASRASDELRGVPKGFASDDDFLEYLQGACFDYFWFEADPRTGLVRDRSEPWSAVSIAATGFALTALGIGVDHNWLARQAGAQRALKILQTLESAPQGDTSTGTSGFKGWFYHFLQPDSGLRFGTSELSSIDTGLLMAGVLYAKEFFDRADPVEREIRTRADRLFQRIDWKWMLNGGETLTMGWHPESGFIKARWEGYNEASILYLMGIGAERGLDPRHWKTWTKTYQWDTNYGFAFVHFPPLFGHQYSACWVDFRELADDYMAAKDITYFENSRRATLAQRAYAISNPKNHAGYGANVWGLTACDGPGSNGALGYSARGTPPPENDDGTIAPTAAGGSLPFTPVESIAALRHIYEMYREKVWCGYGFRDAFNLEHEWWDPYVIGIDQGPILVMAENMRSGAVWKVMQRNAELRRGLSRAGFRPVESKKARK